MVSVSVVLARDRLPTAAAWQRALDELELPVRLDPEVDTASFAGMWPARIQGRGSGFEYFVGRDPGPAAGPLEDPPDRDEIGVTLVSRSARGSRAAVAVAAALAAVSDGQVQDDAEQRVYDRNEALRWARRVLAEGDDRGAPTGRTGSKPGWTSRIRQAIVDHLDPPGVTADWADDDLMPIKIQSTRLELNVSVARPELAQLEAVRSTDAWTQQTRRVGTILGAPAWWCIDREAGLLYILGGHDDETWDVGATLPLAVLDALLDEVSAAVPRA